MEIVRECCSRCDEHLVFDFGVLRNVNIRMDSNAVPDLAAVVYDRVGPDAEMVSYGVFFTEDDVVAGLEVGAYSAAGVDYGAASDHGIVAYGEGGVFDGPGGKVAQDDAGVDLGGGAEDDIGSCVVHVNGCLLCIGASGFLPSQAL